MFVAKPHDAGKPAELDGSDKQKDVHYLAEDPEAKLLQGQDFGFYGNPDAAAAAQGTPGKFTQAPSNSARSGSVSGGGMLHPTAMNTAPKSNPFPAPRSAVRTNPSSIKK